MILRFISVVTLCHVLNKCGGSGFSRCKHTVLFLGCDLIDAKIIPGVNPALRCVFVLCVPLLTWLAVMWSLSPLSPSPRGRLILHSECRPIGPMLHSETVGESSQRTEGTRTATLAHLHSGATGCRNRHAALCFVAGLQQQGCRWCSSSHLILSFSL